MQLLSNVHKFSSSRRARVLVAATATVVGLVNLATPGGASASTMTWANTNTSFNSASAWIGGLPSNSSSVDIGIFQGTPAAQPNLTANRTIGALDFQSAGWVFSGSRLALGVGGTGTGGLSGINSTTNATGTITFNNAIGLNNSPITINSTLNIDMNGEVQIERSLTGTTRTLNVANTGIVNMNGNVRLNFLAGGPAVGTFSVVGQGTGVRTINIGGVIDDGGQPGLAGLFRIDSDSTAQTTVKLTNANTYTGGTVLSGGTLAINQAAALGTGTVTASASATLALLAGTGTATINNTFNIAGATSRTLTLDTGDAGNAMVIPNRIVISGGGVGSITKTNAGTLVLAGNNNDGVNPALNGTINFSGGHLIAAHVNALGTGTIRFGGGTLSAAQPTTFNNTVNMSNLSTIAGDQPITFAGQMLYSGTTDRAESFRNSGGTTIAGGFVITSATSGARQFTISGTEPVNFTSVISEAPGNAGNLRIINSGTVTLGQANTYTGGTVIGDTDADINLGSDQSFGTGTVRWLEGAIRSTGGVRTIANAVSLEPGSTGSIRLAGGNDNWFFTGPMQVSGGTQRQLAIGSNITATISGSISDNADGTGFAKAGAGTLVLTNLNTYAGGTALRNGTTVISNNNNLGFATGTLEFDGGTLRTTAAVTSNRPLFVNTGGGTYNTNGFTSSNNGAMSGTGVFNKDGAGQLSVKHLRTGGVGAHDGTLKVISNGTPANVSQVGTITVGASGIIDMTDNDMIVSGMSKAAVQSLIATGYNFGGYDGVGGVTTSTGANTGNTTLGMLDANEYANNVGDPNFDGVLVQPNDILVKYTYFGDVDFNGQIDASDYNLIDFGFTSHLGGWSNGDADYSGSVDASDYNVIDFAFASQNGVVLRAIQYLDGSDRSQNGMADPSLQKVVEHFEQFGDSYANGFLANVPEPTTIGVIGLAPGALMTRRRRRVAK